MSNSEPVARTAEDHKTPVVDCVNQCFHEGCQWRDLMQVNKDLRERLERTSAQAGELQKQLAAVIEAMKEFRRYV